MTTILVVFFLYSAAVIAFGIYMSRGKQGTGADFLLAGRSLGVLLLVGTLFGTIVGVGSSMGAAGLGYSSGIMGGLFLIGGGIGIYLTGLAFTKIRKYRVVTMAEEASVYFGGNKLINGLLSILMSLAEIGWTAVAIIGAATYIEWILGIPLVWSRVISTLLFGTYIIIGGYLAVVWTDLVQSIILGAGFLTAAILGVRAVGGWSGMANALPESYLSFGSVGIMAMLGLLANQILSPMALPAYRQRIYSAKSEGAAKKSFRVTAVLCLGFAFLPVILGMSAMALEPGLERPDFAFPYMLTAVFPPIIAAIALSAGISAATSSGDSNCISAVNLILNDVLQKVFKWTPGKDQTVKVARITTISVLVFAFAAGLVAKGVIDFIVMLGGTIMVPLSSALLMGRFWRRATWQGATASIFIGAATSLILLNTPNWLSFWGGYTALPVFIIATISGIVVSYITPPTKKDWETVAQELEHQRESFEG